MSVGIERALGSVEGELKGINQRLDQLFHVMSDHTKDDDARFSQLDTRFSKVEKRVYLASGAVATVASFIAYIFHR